MKKYKTSEVAKIIGIHPNTVRLYEEWEFIPKPKRQENGYRIFTDLHLQQIQLVRTAFQIEILQNGLRKQMIKIIKTSAKGEFDVAITLTQDYLKKIHQEYINAKEAISIVEDIVAGKEQENLVFMKRKEVSEYLDISMDALRNWEMNGLLTIKRKQNGYHIYTDDDIKKLKIIRSLRCANYSLQSILRLLQQLSKNPNIDINAVLNNPTQSDDIISVCDRLMTSLSLAEKNAYKILTILKQMKVNF